MYLDEFLEVANNMKKPPLGLKPSYIHDEHRLNEIKGAIARYYSEDLKIPLDWIREYNALIIKKDLLKPMSIKDIFEGMSGYLTNIRKVAEY